MKLKTIKYLGLGLAVATVLTTSAKAQLMIIDYSVDGTSPISVGADTVTLTSIGEPTPVPVAVYDNGVGGPAVTIGELNGVTWHYTGSTGTSFGSATRDMTITVALGSQTLSQTVEVQVKATKAQQLTIQSSLPVDFLYTSGGQNYDLDVTALQLTLTSPVTPKTGTLTGTLNGDFVLTSTPVPEPTTMIAGAMLLLPFGASTLRSLRKNRSA